MIETKRLLLRVFMEADYDDLYEFLSQLEKLSRELNPDGIISLSEGVIP